MGLQIGKGITIANSVEIVFIDPLAPVNLVPPVITGNFASGSTVTVSNGDWTGVPNLFTYTYAWQLDSITVIGATSNTFLLTDSMVGQSISATVTATNATGSASANTISYYINAWGPGQWTVSNTGLTTGSDMFDSTNNYIWRGLGNFATLARTQDGVSWSNVTVPFTNPQSILQANNRLVIWKTGTNAAAYSTTDGNTWVSANSVNSTTNLKSGAFDGANIVILRGDPASNSFMRSTNLGSTWANVDTGSDTNLKRDIVYGNGVFLTVGDFYRTSPFVNTSLISTDGGNTWANSTYIKATSIAYGNEKFVATYPFGANSNPSYAYVSTNNGNTWTQTLLPNQGWTSVVFADNHFIASEGGGNIIYSEDGITWSAPYRTITTLQAGSGVMTYLESQSLLLNGGFGVYVTHTPVPTNPDPNPNQPSNVNASSLNSTQASITWTAPTDPGTSPIINYKIDAIRVDGAATVTQYTAGPVTSYTFTGLVTGKTYYFNVAAVNSSGVGFYTSSEQTILIAPAIGEAIYGGIVISVAGTMATICSSSAGTGFGSWSAAQAFCLSLSNGGYSDWQMPTLTQMNAVNTNRSLIGGYTAGSYWTTTIYNPALPGSYWIVNMPTGANNVGYNVNSYYVRAIRVQFF
jgi:hypothetical protein